PDRRRRDRRAAERQPDRQRQSGGARQLRGSRAQRGRHRAAAGHRDRQLGRVRQGCGSADLLRRTWSDLRGPAACRRPAALRSPDAVLGSDRMASAEAAADKGGGGLIGFAIITVFALGLGAGFGFVVANMQTAPVEIQAEAGAKDEAKEADGAKKTA